MSELRKLNYSQLYKIEIVSPFHLNFQIFIWLLQVTNMNILNATRLRSVKRVRLLSRYHPDEQEAEAVFAAILEHEGIKELNISQNQIIKVNSDTLARAVNFMEQVNIQFYCHCPNPQVLYSSGKKSVIFCFALLLPQILVNS